MICIYDDKCVNKLNLLKMLKCPNMYTSGNIQLSDKCFKTEAYPSGTLPCRECQLSVYYIPPCCHLSTTHQPLLSKSMKTRKIWLPRLINWSEYSISFLTVIGSSIGFLISVTIRFHQHPLVSHLLQYMNTDPDSTLYVNDCRYIVWFEKLSQGKHCW